MDSASGLCYHAVGILQYFMGRFGRTLRGLTVGVGSMFST